MRRLMLIGISLVGVWYVGSLYAYRTSPFKQRTLTGHWPGQPYDWKNDPPAITRRSIEEVSFDDADMKNAVAHWEVLSRRLASTDWHHEGWYSVKRLNSDLIQWWSNTPEWIDPRGFVEQSSLSNDRDIRLVRIQCGISEINKYIWFHSLWQPCQGCTAHLVASTHDGITAVISFGFRRLKSPDGTHAGEFYFDREGTRWKYLTKFDNVNYHINVALPKENTIGLTSAKLSDNMLEVLPRSAEDFLALGMERLDVLEKQIATDIDNSKAVLSVYKTKTVGGDRSDNPPREVPVPIDRPLSDAEKAKVLFAAATELAARRNVLKSNYQEMHEALMKACSTASRDEETP